MAEQKNKRSNGQHQADGANNYLLPQAFEIEQAVLGALLIDKYAFSIVSDILEAESFCHYRHQIIYRAIYSLSTEEKPVDILTVANRLGNDGHLDEVGGPSYISELSSKVASSANVEYHSRILLQKQTARQLIALADKMEKDAFDDERIIETSEESEKEFQKIIQKGIKKDYTHVAPVVGQAVKEIQMAAGNDNLITGISSGYYELDCTLSGFHNSDLIIIGGRTAMGKSAFALNICITVSVMNKIPTVLFSLEMSNVQIVKRMISNYFNIEHTKIINGNLQPDEWDNLYKNAGALLDAPLYLDDTPQLTTVELKRKVRQLVNEHGIRLVIIDYLQLMKDRSEHHNTRQEEVSAISHSLKGLAKSLNIPIIALCQVGREIDKREGLEGIRPRLSDLRESGAIEQDADVVIFVHRPEYYHIYQDDMGHDLRGIAQIIIGKNRHGATGTINTYFKGDYLRFEDPEKEQLGCISESNNYTPYTPFDYDNG